MTEDYVWSDLLNLIAEKKLLFLRDLNQIQEFDAQNPAEKAEKKILIDSLKRKIEKTLENKLSKSGIQKVILLLSTPFYFLEENDIEILNKAQDVSKLLDLLRKVDGEKSEGTIPSSGAYFGMCLNPTCWRVRERITCVSCEDHLVQTRDEKRMIAEVVKCQRRINFIYKDYDATKDHKEQLRSLRSRIATCMFRLHTELEISEQVLIEKIERYVIEQMSEKEILFKDYIEKNAL